MDDGRRPRLDRLRICSWLLLAVVAFSRLLLQLQQMPLYAGLDEAFHVARFSFSAAQNREPNAKEPSVPPYIVHSIAIDGVTAPSFAAARSGWASLRGQQFSDPAIDWTLQDFYVYRNYEAQQPSLGYVVERPLLRMIWSRRTPSRELFCLRLFALLCAGAIIFFTALIAERIIGPAGLFIAALLVEIPNWMTLVLRASNDGLACALIAVALYLSLRPRRAEWLEAFVWALACAVKLYAWPIAGSVLILRMVRREWRSAAISFAAITATVAVTMFDLRARTGSVLGLQEFHSSHSFSSLRWQSIRELQRTFFVTAAWMPGEHGNLLGEKAAWFFLAPSLALILLTLIRVRGVHPQRFTFTLLVFAAFVAAQSIHLVGFLTEERVDARLRGGAEGWYLYALSPLVFGLLIPTAVSTSTRRQLWLASTAVWFSAWDLRLNEFGLFRDWNGCSGPSPEGRFLRWTVQPPFGAWCGLSASTIVWRAIGWMALAILGFLVLRMSRSTVQEQRGERC